MAHRFADQIVLEGELLSALSHDAGLDQLVDRRQQRGRGKAEHRRQIGERERSPQRSGHRGDLTRRIRHAGQALSHARADPVGKPVGGQGRTSGVDSDELLLPQTLEQFDQEEWIAAGLAGHDQEQRLVGLGLHHVARHLRHGGLRRAARARAAPPPRRRETRRRSEAAPRPDPAASPGPTRSEVRRDAVAARATRPRCRCRPTARRPGRSAAGCPSRHAPAATADPAVASSAARVPRAGWLSAARSSNGSGPSKSALSSGASSATDSEGSAAPTPTGKDSRCAILTASPIRRLFPMPAAPSISSTAPEPKRTRSSSRPARPVPRPGRGSSGQTADREATGPLHPTARKTSLVRARRHTLSRRTLQGYE